MPPLDDALAVLIVNTIKRALDPLKADLVALRHDLDSRLATPGPIGPPGPPGEKGLDGVDGLGFDDVLVTFEDRTLRVTFCKGDKVKSFPIELPFPRFCGSFETGTTYQKGDVVMHGGSAWHCQNATTRAPIDGRDEWALFVRRGRDGKDRSASMPPRGLEAH